MKKTNKIIIIILFALAIILFIITPILLNYPPQKHEIFPDNYAIRIIDGDTIELASGDIVRLLCIDTPEEGKEGYEEAKDYLENLILGKEIILQADIQDKDNYNRLLRYVYLNNSNEMIFINKEIYRAGHAKIMIIPPSDSKCEEITFSD